MVSSKRRRQPERAAFEVLFCLPDQTGPLEGLRVQPLFSVSSLSQRSASRKRTRPGESRPRSLFRPDALNILRSTRSLPSSRRCSRPPARSSTSMSRMAPQAGRAGQSRPSDLGWGMLATQVLHVEQLVLRSVFRLATPESGRADLVAALETKHAPAHRRRRPGNCSGVEEVAIDVGFEITGIATNMSEALELGPEADISIIDVRLRDSDRDLYRSLVDTSERTDVKLNSLASSDSGEWTCRFAWPRGR